MATRFGIHVLMIFGGHLGLMQLGGVAEVGKFLITWTPEKTKMQQNHFGQARPTIGPHFCYHKTYTIRFRELSHSLYIQNLMSNGAS